MGQDIRNLGAISILGFLKLEPGCDQGRRLAGGLAWAVAPLRKFEVPIR